MPDRSRLSDHGAILRVLAAGLCGSDLHAIDDPATPAGTIIGHEMLGEVVDVGEDLPRSLLGRICLVPFNVSCGDCPQCLLGLTCHCTNAFPPRVGSTYGMGMGWDGFQTEIAVVPWARHNLVPVPESVLPWSEMVSLVLATDVLPTALHTLDRAGVTDGSRVYVAGGGPIGLAVALVARVRGAHVIVGEPNPVRADRIADAGLDVLDPGGGSLSDQLEAVSGVPWVDVGVDCVGVNASTPERATAAGRTVDSLIDVVRHGGTVAMPGVYPAKLPAVPTRLGSIWSKSLRLVAGPTPALAHVDAATNLLLEHPETFTPLAPQAVPLDDAVAAHADFRTGRLTKAVLTP